MWKDVLGVVDDVSSKKMPLGCMKNYIVIDQRIPGEFLEQEVRHNQELDQIAYLAMKKT
jgi:hypothetical protein